MVELVVGVLRFCPRDMNRDAEAVILLQCAVQPQIIMDNKQVKHVAARSLPWSCCFSWCCLLEV